MRILMHLNNVLLIYPCTVLYLQVLLFTVYGISNYETASHTQHIPARAICLLVENLARVYLPSETPGSLAVDRFSYMHDHLAATSV